MTPINQVDINAYVFASIDMPDSVFKKHSKDLEKLFPTSQYQGRTINLKWHFNTETNKKPNRREPTVEPKQKLKEDLIVYMPDVKRVGRAETDLVKEAYITPLTPALKPSSKILIQVGYPVDQAEDDGAAGAVIKTWANKKIWEVKRRKQSSSSVVSFVYRRDQIENPDYRNHKFFLNEKDVIQAIEEIVKVKLDALATQPANKTPAKLTAAPAKSETPKKDQPAAAQAVNEPVKLAKVEPKAAAKEEEKKVNAPPVAAPVVNEPVKIEEKAEEVKQEAVQKEEGPAPVQDKKSFRFVTLILSAIPSLIAAVTAVASRIFLPKIKDVGAVGLGFLAGWIYTLAFGFLMKKKGELNAV